MSSALRSSPAAAPGLSRRAARVPSGPLVAVHALFFVSGALGVCYEVLWMRRFSTLFGSTTLAAAATLSAFFLGTAIGSLILGARVRRWPNPLRAFGGLEIGVGIGALLVGPAIQLYGRLYPLLYQALSPHPEAFACVKAALAVVAVALPTFFMGGTLPVLGEGIVPARQRLGVPISGLYALNVLGAATGALLVPFVLLPNFGVRGAEIRIIATSLCLGACALIVARRASSTGGLRDAPGPGRQRTQSVPLPPRAIWALAAWSGLATLGLEALWVQAFSLVHEHSLYAFSVVVVVFLIGLAGGAALARLALGRGLAARRVLGWAWTIAGLLVIVSPRLFDYLTHGLAALPREAWLPSATRLFILAAVVLLPACTGLGAALPVLMDLAGGESESTGLVLGRVLAANTAGAILGPLAATFVVAPLLGLWVSLVIVGSVTVALGSLVGLGRRSWVLSGALVVVAVLGLRPGTVALVRVRQARGERLLDVYRGSYGITAVLDDGHDRWITVNNTYILGGAAAAAEERWQGHLPLLLHPSAHRTVALGLGTGITAGALLGHPVRRIAVLEIVPEVVRASREHFADINAGLLTDPRVTVAIDDGRNYLRGLPPGSVDAVVGDLLVPWRSGESALYTREHFLAVRRALSRDGIFCQWLPLYQLSERQLAIVLRTFLDAFPSTTVWRGNFLPDEPTLALVGHRSGEPLDVPAVDRAAGALGASERSESPMLSDPAGVWLRLVGAPRIDAPWLAEVPLNTDDAPWVELLSPRTQRPLVGAAMEAVLTRIASSPLTGSPLASLDAQHRRWWRAGRALGRASLDRGPRGEGQVLGILRTLPLPLRRALGVDG